jgi:hypothetical protein
VVAVDAPPVWLEASTPLSGEEFAHAIRVSLALNGLALMDDGDQFVQLVAIGAATTLAAPVRVPAAPLLDPSSLPVASGAATTADTLSNRLRHLYLKFLGDSPPWPPSIPRQVDRLVELYADLKGLKATRSDTFGQVPVFFEITTPLTEPEVLYAIETTLRLNNLAVVPAGKDSVRAGHISEGRATKQTEPPDRNGPRRTDAP